MSTANIVRIEVIIFTIVMCGFMYWLLHFYRKRVLRENPDTSYAIAKSMMKTLNTLYLIMLPFIIVLSLLWFHFMGLF